MRGLKRKHGVTINVEYFVASFTDAWIETMFFRFKNCHYWSHLLQMRGLKQIFEKITDFPNVASFTDAWIET